MAQKWTYEQIDPETGKIKYAPTNDPTGEITGRHVFGLTAWFDEHPEERIALGWIKHIRTNAKDIDYNRQTQYLARSVRWIDDYTCEDVYHVMDKSEEMMRLEELTRGGLFGDADAIGWGGDEV